MVVPSGPLGVFQQSSAQPPGGANKALKPTVNHLEKAGGQAPIGKTWKATDQRMHMTVS